MGLTLHAYVASSNEAQRAESEEYGSYMSFREVILKDNLIEFLADLKTFWVI
ncbi:MAG: hypothetical protein QXI32_06045 [Candidatus Bathyarchaeia archaeon]